MQKYISILGNTPELSTQELISVLGESNVTQISDVYAEIMVSDDQKAQELINILGGTVKILKQIEILPKGTPAEDLENKIVETLMSIQEGWTAKTGEKFNKVQFAISELGRDHLETLNYHNVKTQIQEHGKTARFIEGSRHGLSAAILIHKKNIIELNLIQNEDSILFAQTLSTQDIDNWTVVDREKPYFDRKKGMLPPKVARMMLNIALADNSEVKPQDGTLLDPFCGTGTVLIESLQKGVKAIGSDLDLEAVAGAKKNLEWFKELKDIDTDFEIIMSDAANIRLKNKVDYIVSEPFLGKPKPNIAKLPYIYKGLEKLYLGAFKNWTNLLNNGASITIIFPMVEYRDEKGRKKAYNLDSLIDKLANFGYTTLSKPILYSRPQATVQRQIYRFKFNK